MNKMTPGHKGRMKRKLGRSERARAHNVFVVEATAIEQQSARHLRRQKEKARAKGEHPHMERARAKEKVTAKAEEKVPGSHVGTAERPGTHKPRVGHYIQSK